MPHELKESTLELALAIDEVDEAFRLMMDELGITDGGGPDLVYEGDLHEDWEDLSELDRRGVIENWIEFENSLL